MNYDSLCDEELVALSKSGDTSCVNELLRRHKSTVNKAVRRFFLPFGDNDDLMQEGTLALYNAIMSFDESAGASFKTFAYLCVRRRIYDLIRESTSVKNRALLDSVPLDEVETPYNNPETLYIEDEREKLLLQEIDKILSDEEKKIFDAYLNGNSYKEIATSLSVSTKKVDNTLQKIRKSLKKSLNS